MQTRPTKDVNLESVRQSLLTLSTTTAPTFGMSLKFNDGCVRGRQSREMSEQLLSDVEGGLRSQRKRRFSLYLPKYLQWIKTMTTMKKGCLSHKQKLTEVLFSLLDSSHIIRLASFPSVFFYFLVFFYRPCRHFLLFMLVVHQWILGREKMRFTMIDFSLPLWEASWLYRIHPPFPFSLSSFFPRLRDTHKRMKRMKKFPV